MFDFIELAPEHSERELKQALIHHIPQFLSEMGGKFDPADVGQLQFYLTALDEQEKPPFTSRRHRTSLAKSLY